MLYIILHAFTGSLMSTEHIQVSVVRSINIASQHFIYWVEKREERSCFPSQYHPFICTFACVLVFSGCHCPLSFIPVPFTRECFNSQILTQSQFHSTGGEVLTQHRDTRMTGSEKRRRGWAERCEWRDRKWRVCMLVHWKRHMY